MSTSESVQSSDGGQGTNVPGRKDAKAKREEEVCCPWRGPSQGYIVPGRQMTMHSRQWWRADGLFNGAVSGALIEYPL